MRPLVSLLILALGLNACRPEPGPPGVERPAGPSGESDADEGDPSGAPHDSGIDDAALVAQVGDVVVYVDEVIRGLEYRALLEGTPVQHQLPPGWDQNDAALGRLVDRAVEAALLDREAARLGLNPTPAAVDSALVRYPSLQAFVTASEGSDTGLELLRPDDVRREVARNLAMLAWVAQAAQEPDPAALRARWERANTTLVVEMIIVPPTPSTERVDQIVEREAARIEAYYAAHPGRFRARARARAQVVTVPAPPQTDIDARAEARARAEQLREIAAVRGIEAVAREHSSDPSASSGGDIGWTLPADHGALFEVPAGELSPVAEGSGVFWFGVANERVEPGLLPLEATLRRTIAWELARDEGPGAEALAVANAILSALAEGRDTAALVEEHNLRWQRTIEFPQSLNGSVPLVGIAPELSDALFRQLMSPGDFTPRPFYTEEGLVLARLVQRSDPRPGQWELDRDAYTATARRELRAEAWPRFVADYTGSQLQRTRLDVLRTRLLERFVPEGPP